MKEHMEYPCPGDVVKDAVCRFKVSRVDYMDGCPAWVWFSNIGGPLDGARWYMHILDYRAGFADCRLVRRGKSAALKGSVA